MRQRYEYKVVRDTIGSIEKEVAQLLNEGWVCVGGVSIVDSGGGYYHQALQRTTDVEEHMPPEQSFHMKCNICDGHGVVNYTDPPEVSKITCRVCDGLGKVCRNGRKGP